MEIRPKGVELSSKCGKVLRACPWGFHTGDCHAKQGQGEVCGVAMEIAAKITLKFSLIKRKKIKWPRIESSSELMCVDGAKPIEIAYSELLGWLKEIGWDRNEAYQAIPKQVNYT